MQGKVDADWQTNTASTLTDSSGTIMDPDESNWRSFQATLGALLEASP